MAPTIAVLEEAPLLNVSDLRVDFRTPAAPVKAVRGLTYSIAPGEVLAIVGESGSGKSAGALALMGLLPASARVRGSVRFLGREVLGLSEQTFSEIRGKRIAMVFQDPLSSLNPVLTIGRQMTEGIRRHLGLSARAARQRAMELLARAGLPDPRARLQAYPHECSGGTRQRIMIAMALSCDPALLIADEPTTALDVTTQAQILDLLRGLRRDRNLSVILITHNLGLAAGLADRISVMYAGRIVETGPIDRVLANPIHPYTLGLLQSVPRLDRARLDELVAIEGLPPDLSLDIVGCPFQPRCRFAVEKCRVADPPLIGLRGHASACWVLPNE